jgi:hypothetical protein
MTETDIGMSEGIKIHHRGALENLVFLKRQQWTITNHALVVYAAVVALARDTNDIERTILSGLGLLACGYATWCMVHTQKSMTRYYRNVYEMHQKYFSVEERERLELHRERPGFSHNFGFMVAYSLPTFSHS